MENDGIHNYCWFELATTAPNDAKRFYTALFGWSYETMPMPGGPEYTIIQQGSATVGALYELTPETGLGKMPPSWTPYVAVKSADDAVRKAKELGGTVVQEPFDVMDMGRMAALSDPTGPTLSVWQAKGPGPGAEMDYRAKGRVCWVECMTRDAKKASAFYGRLFGWEIKADKPDYIEYGTNGAPLGGFFELQGKSDMAQVPPHWVLYFATDDVDASTEQLVKLGGKVYAPPTDLPHVGRFSVVADPQGAEFYLFRLNDSH